MPPKTPEQLAQSRAYWNTHKEDLNERRRLTYQADPTKVNESNKRSYQKHRAERDATNRAWAEAHPDDTRAIKAKYRETHREELRAKGRAYKATRYAQDPEKARQEARTHYAKHRDILAARARQYRAENPDTMKETQRRFRQNHPGYDRTWNQAHPEVHQATEERRRAHKAAAAINDFTRAQWEVMKQHYGHRCVYCGRKMKRLTMDHLTPISKGGNHTASNIVPACQICNSIKGTKTPLLPVQPLLLIPS